MGTQPKKPALGSKIENGKVKSILRKAVMATVEESFDELKDHFIHHSKILFIKYNALTSAGFTPVEAIQLCALSPLFGHTDNNARKPE